MDRYAEEADSYTEQEDYNLCMAKCPEGRDCGCGGGNDPRGWLALGLTILLFVAVGMIIHLVETYKDNKEYKEWKEKNKIRKGNKNE